MSIELKILLWSVVLGIAQLLAAAQASTKQRGLQWNFSPRDEKPEPLTGVGARIDRAWQNFRESFPLFLAAVILVQLTGRNNLTTAIGVQLYFWARIFYVPLYALGIPVVRTLVWTASMVGIALLLIGLM